MTQNVDLQQVLFREKFTKKEHETEVQQTFAFPHKVI